MTSAPSGKEERSTVGAWVSVAAARDFAQTILQAAGDEDTAHARVLRAEANLVLAASELAANTLRHTSGGGTLRVWHTGLEILCQVEDEGWITDPLAGRRRRPAAEPGHGLWLVNQVCDLVDLRSGPGGTAIRLHMRRPGAERRQAEQQAG